MDKIAQHSTALKTLLIIASLTAIGLLCYWFVLSLPLFWDDIFQFAWLDGVGLRDIWTSPVPGLAYFRPLAFTVWKMLRVVQGPYTDPSLHFANLFLHILNACLLACVVAHLAQLRKTLTGIASAILFLLFPFSFQAVAPINSLMHPLAACFILAAILTHQVSATRAGYVLRFISILLAATSIFAHENGALAPALVTLTALCTQPRRPLKRVIVDVIPYWAATLICFIFWRNATGSGSLFTLDTITTQLESRLQNGTYFMQALAYPVSFLARVVKPVLAQPNDLVAILVVCIPCVLCWAILAWRVRRGAYVVWGVAWFVLAALPACMLLSFNYVLESPRLLYLSSIGAAVFWATPLSFSWTSRTANRLSLLVSSFIILAMGIWGYTYIQKRASLYSMLGHSISQLGTATQHNAACGQGERDSTLLINFPDWFFVGQSEYLIGHDGIALVSSVDELENLYRMNFGTEPVFSNAVLPDILPPNADFVGMGQKQTQDSLEPIVRTARQVIASSTGTVGGGVHYVGCLQAERQPMPDKYQALIDQRLILLDSALSFNPVRKELKVTLDWQVQSPSQQDTTVFAQVLDASGKLIAQSDGYPLAGTSPIRLWHTGDVWHDVRHLRLKGLDPASVNQVVVGAYLTQSTKRLPAMDAKGQRLPGDMIVLTRQLKRPN
jgi:hypothetical protein